MADNTTTEQLVIDVRVDASSVKSDLKKLEMEFNEESKRLQKSLMKTQNNDAAKKSYMETLLLKAGYYDIADKRTSIARKIKKDAQYTADARFSEKINENEATSRVETFKRRKDAIAAFTSPEFSRKMMIPDAISGFKDKLASFRSAISDIKKDLADISGAFPKAFPKTFAAVNALKSAFGKLGSITAKLVKSPFKKLGSSLTNLSRAFKRILIYRSIRAFMSIVNKGFTEGVHQNLSKFELAMGNIGGTSILSTMSSMKTSIQSVTNSFGSLASEVLAFVKPAFETIMSVISKVADSITQLFAALNGQSVFKKATAAAYDYGKAIGDAKKQLFGFDELNVLNGNGGANEGGTAYSDMYELADVASPFKQIADSIKENFDSIKDKVDNVVGSLKKTWGTLGGFVSAVLKGDYDKIREYTTALFEDLSGLLSNAGELIIAIIPGALNIVESVILGFADWVENIIVSLLEYLDKNTGLHLKTLITTVKETFTMVKDLFSGLMKDIKGALGGIIEMITGVLNGDWKKVWNGFLTVVRNVFDAIGRFIQTAINLIVSGINGLLSGVNAILGTNWHINTPTMSKSASSTIKDISSGYYANGGVPDTGSLFWAGEAGPELVTSVGGRNTVYNQQQLGSSLAYANKDVVNAINTLISVVRSKDSKVVISTNDVRKAINSTNMRYGV